MVIFSMVLSVIRTTGPWVGYQFEIDYFIDLNIRNILNLIFLLLKIGGRIVYNYPTNHLQMSGETARQIPPVPDTQ